MLHCWASLALLVVVLWHGASSIIETVDLSGIIQELEAIKGDIKINDAAIKFLDAKIEELKAEQDNPLLN
jgi:cell division protein FtsB